KCHPALRRHIVEELPKSLQTAGRSPDSDDGEILCLICCRRVCLLVFRDRLERIGTAGILHLFRGGGFLFLAAGNRLFDGHGRSPVKTGGVPPKSLLPLVVIIEDRYNW